MAVCDICGDEYEKFVKNIGPEFCPVHMSDSIRIERIIDGDIFIKTYKTCPACAQRISKLVENEIMFAAARKKKGE